jgi:hypothetical protein
MGDILRERPHVGKPDATRTYPATPKVSLRPAHPPTPQVLATHASAPATHICRGTGTRREGGTSQTRCTV